MSQHYLLISIHHILAVANKSGKLRSQVLQEIIRMARLDNFPVVHDEDPVTAEDGVDAVCDGDDGPVRQTLLHHLLHVAVCLQVHIGRGLQVRTVESQSTRHKDQN